MPRRWSASATVLVAANLVPLLGVVVLDWDVFSVVFLFWIENVMVGLFNVLRMLWVERGAGRAPVAKIVLIPFFVFHYGMFTSCTAYSCSRCLGAWLRRADSPPLRTLRT